MSSLDLSLVCFIRKNISERSSLPTQLKSDICSTNVPTFCVQCMGWCMCGLHSMKKSICKHEIQEYCSHFMKNPSSSIGQI